jgi:hypothetical protein
MKSFDFCKLPLVLAALGGALIFAPGARAQSEIAPDHFDSPDSRGDVPTAKAPAAKPKLHELVATQQAPSNKSAGPALRPVAAHELAANKKRKPAARKSTNQSN